MYTPSHFLPTSVSVDLGALAQNFAHVRRLAPRSEVLAVVKANAYGHGAVEITRALQRLTVHRFAVATVDEGIALRQAGVQDAIVVMGATVPAQFADLVAHQLTPVLYRADMVRAFADKVPPGAKPYPVHIKIETGMGRLGLSPQEMPGLIGRPDFQTVLRLEGLMTHLADADNHDARHTEAQLARFQQTLEILQQRGLALPLVHAANSAAIVKYPASRYSLVRPGIMLYGYQTLAQEDPTSEVRPILTWKTTIAHLHNIQRGDSVSYNRMFIASRRSRIAVLPVGYADGYNRLLSNRGVVLIGGRRAPVVGRVCMDMTMIDVTDVPGVEIGHEAILIGQQGQERITATDLASWQQTIPYEILCAIGPRVPRQYIPLPPGSTAS
ncbi:MAG: alanine racemase [Nitrospira defluvii]|nr:alanine racemase [Nitrospira defluvii]